MDRFRFFTLTFIVALALSAAAHAQKEPPPIQDNSFLVEEAYNQEKGVVQHINTFNYFAMSHDWAYTFTQEWPVGGLRNQLSYTLQSVRPGDFAANAAGVGDVLINYRYQAVGTGETRTAFSPRLTLILPTGKSELGHGYGGVGWQTNLPVSVVLLPKLVSHWNAGTTFVAHGSNERRERGTMWSYNAGQSLIWLARPRFNVMLETYYVNAQNIVSANHTQWSPSWYVSPGIRWAYNLAGGLQVVPGLAMPVGVGPSAGEKGVMVYLSFEHPFRRVVAE